MLLLATSQVLSEQGSATSALALGVASKLLLMAGPKKSVSGSPIRRSPPGLWRSLDRGAAMPVGVRLPFWDHVLDALDLSGGMPSLVEGSVDWDAVRGDRTRPEGRVVEGAPEAASLLFGFCLLPALLRQSIPGGCAWRSSLAQVIGVVSAGRASAPLAHFG